MHIPADIHFDRDEKYDVEVKQIAGSEGAFFVINFRHYSLEENRYHHFQMYFISEGEVQDLVTKLGFAYQAWKDASIAEEKAMAQEDLEPFPSYEDES